MRILSAFLLLAPIANGAESSGAGTIRETLRARIRAAAPPPPPADPAGQAAPPAPPPIILQPVVVAESKLVQAAGAVIARAEQDRRDGEFAGGDGGRIAKLGPLHLGSWFDRESGWTFLSLNPAPTRRQTEAAAERLRDLEGLLRIGTGKGADRKP